MHFDPIELFPGAQLRCMERSDVEDVVSIEKRSGGSRPCPRSVFLARLELPGFLNAVLVLGGAVVGYAVISVSGDEADWVKLVNGERGAPLAAHAVKALKLYLASLGVTHIVGRCAPELLSYYIRLGCQSRGVLPGFFGAKRDAVSLVLFL